MNEISNIKLHTTSEFGVYIGARTSDPASSHIAVARIDANESLNAHVVAAARRLAPAEFDDWDLLDLVEEQTGRRQQRNVIARARGRMEQLGELVRVGLRERAERTQPTLHFRIPQADVDCPMWARCNGGDETVTCTCDQEVRDADR